MVLVMKVIMFFCDTNVGNCSNDYGYDDIKAVAVLIALMTLRKFTKVNSADADADADILIPMLMLMTMMTTMMPARKMAAWTRRTRVRTVCV